jgi:protein-S-isoprenylcysteine O-methyltransferase Ste14
VAQFVLLALVPVAAFLPPPWPDGGRVVRIVAGALLAVLGAAVAVWAARALGRWLTPFPRPLAEAAVVDTGPYAYVRHPIYAGALVLLVGVALLTSPAVLAVTAALALLWVGKAGVEEKHMAELVPGYHAYCARVRRRIVPGVY